MDFMELLIKSIEELEKQVLVWGPFSKVVLQGKFGLKQKKHFGLPSIVVWVTDPK